MGAPNGMTVRSSGLSQSTWREYPDPRQLVYLTGRLAELTTQIGGKYELEKRTFWAELTMRARSSPSGRVSLETWGEAGSTNSREKTVATNRGVSAQGFRGSAILGRNCPNWSQCRHHYLNHLPLAHRHGGRHH